MNRKELQALVDEFKAQAKIGRQNPSKASKKSEEWITGQMKRIKSHKVSRPQVGKMYMFGYDAKYKDTLPYWDMYPLIICIGVSPTHMLGLNLHYIPPRVREPFLLELMKFASTKNLSNKTKLKINWNKVKGMKGAEHMIKMYIGNNIRLGLMEVPPKDWHNAINLRTQKFVSKGKSISATRSYNDYYKKR